MFHRVVNRLFVTLTLSGFFLAGVAPAGASRDPLAREAPAGAGPVVQGPVAFGETNSLREMSIPAAQVETPGPDQELPSPLPIPRSTGSRPAGAAPGESILQDTPGLEAMPSPTTNFEGIENDTNRLLYGFRVLPPDTNGDVGPNHYVQTVNLAFAVYDRSGTLLWGPAPISTVFAGLGPSSICALYDDGDPVVQYDHLADRWLISQFALDFATPEFHQCIAVSQGADPTGGWNAYDYLISTTKLNDYPKFGVWPDGYYMSVNQFDGVTFGWEGAGVVAFDRSKMLTGDPTATMIYFDVGAVDLSFGGMLPSDLDGPPPASGTPNYYSEWDDSGWLGDPDDTLRIWEFDVDWTTPANSSFGADAFFTPNEMVTTADVDPNMCGYSRDCIPQPGVGSTAYVDAISDRLMYRLQYRDYGSYSTLVSNHTVDADGTDHAGIHWFVLRDSGSGWAMDQQGVYAPDSDHRWMGSAGLDASGNLALGYSVSSSTTYPSIRYAGRLVIDPAGTLPQGETSLIAGSGSQTHTASRWGDYSMMALDPADNGTFWYTQEYVKTTTEWGTSAPWRTRVGSFVMPQFPTFADVPTSYWAWLSIERIHALGMTGGCATGPLRYCPDDTATRGEMAVFLKRGIHGASYTPPAPNGSHPFTDISGHWAEAWIEDLYDEGLTGGFPDGTYRPDADVSRAEMAVLLLGAEHGTGYTPPAPTGIFSDVPTSHWAAAWIEQLYNEGITSGCGTAPLRFCPSDPTTRSQMAVFLVLTFGYP